MPKKVIRNRQYSLDFDGVNDEVSMGDNFDKERTDAFGFSFEIFLRNATDLQTIVQKRDLGNEGYELFYGSTDNKFSLTLEGSNGTRLIVESPALPIKEWLFIEVTYDGSGSASGVKFYNKGLPLATTTFSDTLNTDITNSEDFMFGIRKGGTGDLDAKLTNFRIHNAERSAAKVKNSYFNKVFTDVQAHWPFTDGQGLTLTATIGGVNGTITGAAWSRVTPFNPRKAVRDFPYANTFNGTSDKISLSAGADFPMYSAGATYSLAGWIKLDNASGSRAIYGEGNTAGNNQEWELFVEGTTNKIRLLIQNDANATIATITSDTALEEHRWYHIGFTDDNGTAKLYIDGLLDSQSFDYTPSGAVTMNTANLGITERSSDSFDFSGKLTRFAFAASTVWTDQEMRDLYLNSTIPSGATASYLNKEGAGTVLTDDIGSNNGTIASGAAWSRVTPSKPRPVVEDLPFANTFNGTTDEISLDGSDLPIYPSDGDGTYSIEFRFKMSAIVLNQNVFSESFASGVNQEWQWRFKTDGTLTLILQNNANTTIYSIDTNTVFEVGRWYHIIYTDNDGDADFYVNGHLDSADFDYVVPGAPPSVFTFNSTTLGAIERGGANTGFFNGKITRPVFYNTKLTAAQVRNRYYNSVLHSSAIAEYLTDEGTGTTLADNIGDNTGTLANDAWSTDTPSKNKTAVTQARTAVT